MVVLWVPNLFRFRQTADRIVPISHSSSLFDDGFYSQNFLKIKMKTNI